MHWSSRNVFMNGPESLIIEIIIKKFFPVAILQKWFRTFQINILGWKPQCVYVQVKPRFLRKYIWRSSKSVGGYVSFVDHRSSTPSVSWLRQLAGWTWKQNLKYSNVVWNIECIFRIFYYALRGLPSINQSVKFINQILSIDFKL